MRRRAALALLLALGCASDAERAREAFAPAVEKTELAGLERGLARAADLAAAVDADLAEGNYGKARAGAMELRRSAELLRGWHAPLLRAKNDAALASKLLRMEEGAAAAEAAERAAAGIAAAGGAAPDPARAARAAALAADLRAVRGLVEGRRNIARYKLEEAAAGLNELLAPAEAP